MRRAGWGILCAGALLAAQSPASPRITYSRAFPHSDPAFFQISMEQNGQTRFQEREHDGDPLETLTFTASPSARREVFAEAAAVDDFSRPLQAKDDNVAYTGTKLLAFDSAAGHHAQTFTYTTLRPAAELVNFFEGIGTAGADALRLERRMRFQRLDVLDAVRNIRDDWDNKEIAEPQLLLPTLNQLIRDPAQMKAARDVAKQLAAAIEKKQTRQH